MSSLQPIQISEIPDTIKQYAGEIHSIRFPQQGCTSDLGIIECNGISLALKRAKDPLYNAWLKKEHFVLRCLSTETTIPVPKIKKLDIDSDKTQVWLLMEFLEGRTLRTALSKETNQAVRSELIYNFGKMLHQIHSTACPKELMKEEPWLEAMLADAEYNLANYKVDGSKILLEKISSNKPKAFAPTLIHGDFTMDNVLVENGKISAVIDWAGGTYGDPRYDVSLSIRPKPGLFESENDKEMFFQGYGKKIIDNEEYEYFANGLYEFF
ncbi:phosphotransferase family protein [Gracilibacillus xinjiangensis]|uniref:Phosphotransferase family protein n=1 Tax=Gracilibacillus xinjiangensis TaxID=1193282 RepID=A0ABV8WVY1_9BACI